MSVATALPEIQFELAERELPALGPILVATDATAQSNGALKAAAQLAAGTEADVTVLSVVEPIPPVAADFGVVLPPPEADGARRDDLLVAVKNQIASVAGPTVHWPIDVRDGDPAETISRATRELNARIAIVGLGRHDLLDRLFGSETALRTLRKSRAPVFAVSPNYNHLPTRAIVATDFSPASVRAARIALDIFGSITAVYLVHVAPRLELQPEAFAAWMSLYGEGVAPAFERIKAEIGFRPDVHVEVITLEGKPSRALLQFANTMGVDLIVTGSRGAGLINRLLIGSTATGLVRGAQCSVLAVPAPSIGERVALETAGERVTLDEAQWASELAAFTKRNAGRRASLEVDDLDLGAQRQEHDYPFLGIAYDRHDRRIEIMVGDFEGVFRHLTRSIGDVTSIDVLRDEHGRDCILRIAHGGAQTILTLA